VEDGAALEALLAEEARALNDGGGEFFAARRPISGRARVIRFHLGLRRKFQSDSARCSLAWCNGAPALVIEQERSHPRLAPLLVSALDLDAEGRVRTVYTFLATGKLTHVGPRRAR
jgi:RNA polymerase sigma-70 factor (ECF subfamily)